MFYSAEDVQPVADIAVQLFGRNGNLLEGKNVTKNVIIGSNEFGKIWYGDVDGDMEYVRSLCTVLTQRVGQNISVVTERF